MKENGQPLTNQWNDFLLRKVDPYATAKYEILLHWLGDAAGKTALVVGSGSGEFAALLAQSGARVTATDISREYVELTQQTAARFGVSIQTRVGRLEDLGSDGQRFDLVAATDVIEHIEDDGTAASQLHRLLKPDGLLLVTVPALPSLFGYHDEVLGHFRRYTRPILRALLEKDFRIARMRYYGFFLIPVAFLISRLLRRPYPVSSFQAAGKKRSLAGVVIRLAFRWEKLIRPPIGTSLLLLASPKPSLDGGAHRFPYAAPLIP